MQMGLLEREALVWLWLTWPHPLATKTQAEVVFQWSAVTLAEWEARAAIGFLRPQGTRVAARPASRS